jgi:hypothetical protein
MPSSSFIARFVVLTMIVCRLKSSLICVQETFVVSSTLFIMPRSSSVEIPLHSSHADHMLQDWNCSHTSRMNWTNQITEVEAKELHSLTSLSPLLLNLVECLIDIINLEIVNNGLFITIKLCQTCSCVKWFTHRTLLCVREILLNSVVMKALDHILYYHMDLLYL